MKRDRFIALVGAVLFVCFDTHAAEILRLDPSLGPSGRRQAMQTGTVSTNGKVIAINGDPVVVDTAELRRSADFGVVSSQVRLARYLDQGKHGLLKNPIEAYTWAAIAAAQGNNEAMHLANEFALFLTPEQRAAGTAAATAFLEKQKSKKSER